MVARRYGIYLRVFTFDIERVSAVRESLYIFLGELRDSHAVLFSTRFKVSYLSSFIQLLKIKPSLNHTPKENKKETWLGFAKKNLRECLSIKAVHCSVTHRMQSTWQTN